jgi:hypothetical protein
MSDELNNSEPEFRMVLDVFRLRWVRGDLAIYQYFCGFLIVHVNADPWKFFPILTMRFDASKAKRHRQKSIWLNLRKEQRDEYVFHRFTGHLARDPRVAQSGRFHLLDERERAAVAEEELWVVSDESDDRREPRADANDVRSLETSLWRPLGQR